MQLYTQLKQCQLWSSISTDERLYTDAVREEYSLLKLASRVFFQSSDQGLCESI
jgi:hypothetical protein